MLSSVRAARAEKELSLAENTAKTWEQDIDSLSSPLLLLFFYRFQQIVMSNFSVD